MKFDREGKGMSFRKLKCVLIPVLLVAGATAFAHSSATGIVKERMDAMKAIGEATKIIAAMMQGKQAYDAAVVASAATSIEHHAGSGLLDQFPEGSLDAPTEALPVIWDDWVGFKSGVEDLRREAALLASVAGNGPDGFGETAVYTDDRSQPAGPVATRLLKTCKGCHDKFREDD